MVDFKMVKKAIGQSSLLQKRMHVIKDLIAIDLMTNDGWPMPHINQISGNRKLIQTMVTNYFHLPYTSNTYTNYLYVEIFQFPKKHLLPYSL